VLELRFWKAFGEDISLLLFGIDVLGDDPFGFANLRSEEMILQCKVFVPGRHLRDIDKGKTAHVVFEDGGTDKTGLEKASPQFSANLLEQCSHEEDFPHSHAECDIFCSSASESDFSLQFALPDNGASKQC
jgi:hypothetical protein